MYFSVPCSAEIGPPTVRWLAALCLLPEWYGSFVEAFLPILQLYLEAIALLSYLLQSKHIALVVAALADELLPCIAAVELFDCLLLLLVSLLKPCTCLPRLTTSC